MNEQKKGLMNETETETKKEFSYDKLESLVVPCGWCAAGGIVVGGIIVGICVT